MAAKKAAQLNGIDFSYTLPMSFVKFQYEKQIRIDRRIEVIQFHNYVEDKQVDW